MKIFISWSGERSRCLAEALHNWLPRVIQAVKPWLSTNEILTGARWEAEIAKELQDAKFGIVCLTSENLDSRWLNFEAGAISKVVGHGSVCPYLLDIEGTDIDGPLSQFQATKATQPGTLKLLNAINKSFDPHPLTSNQLDETFQLWWPKLDELLKAIPKTASTPVKRPDRELLEETLVLTRSSGTVHQRVINEIRLLRQALAVAISWRPSPPVTITPTVEADGTLTIPIKCLECQREWTERLSPEGETYVVCPGCGKAAVVNRTGGKTTVLTQKAVIFSSRAKPFFPRSLLHIVFDLRKSPLQFESEGR